MKIVNVKPVVAEMELARLRPDFGPIFPRFSMNALEGSDDSTSEETEGGRKKRKGRNYIEPGTFWDLLQMPTESARGVTSNQMYKAIRSFSSRELKKAMEGKAQGRTASIKKVSAIHHFADNVRGAFLSIIDEGVPENYAFKVKDPEDDFYEADAKKDAPHIKDGKPRKAVSYYTKPLEREFYSNLKSLGDEVIVGRGNSGWKISLPLGMYKFDALVSPMVNPLIEYDAASGRTIRGDDRQLEVCRSIANAFKEIGINLFSSTESDVMVKYDEMLRHYGEAQKIPQLNDFIKNYVVGVRVEVTAPPPWIVRELKAKRAAAAEKEGKALINNSDIKIVDDTNTVNTVELPNEDDISDLPIVGNKNIFTEFFNREIKFYLVVNLPDVEAEYYVQTEASRIRPTNLLEYFRTLYSNRLYPVLPYYFPISELESKNQGFATAPGVNRDLIAIDRNNYPYYIPNVNNIALYEELTSEKAALPTGEFSFRNIANVNPDNLSDRTRYPGNRLIYTDWVNNKLAYTDQRGKLCVMDLEELYPIRPHAIISHLKAPIEKVAGANGRLNKVPEIVEKLFGLKVVDVYLQHINQLDTSKFDFINTFIYNKLRFILSSASNGATSFIKILVLIDELYREAEGKENKRAADETSITLIEALSLPVARPLIEYIKQAKSYIDTHLDDIIARPSTNPTFTLNCIASWILIANYVEKMPELYAEDMEKREVYLKNDPDIGDPEWKASFKNVGDGKALKHYQARALSVLDKSPEFAILAVDAGGGKTITIICNILQELDKGTVKKPLVLCPSHLVKDYVGAIADYCEGRMNGVVINRMTFDNYTQDQMLALVQNAPPNTIFVADYDIFKRGRTLQAYSNLSVEKYQHLDFFRIVGFDGVWCDESHFLKNADSGRARAVRYAISEIPLKRLATGTLAPNKLVDIVNQFAFFDPTVFGSREQFQKAKEDAMKEIFPASVMNRLKGHCTFIRVSRREWAAELPHKEQEFHPVQLTENQLIAYKAIFADSMKDLENLLENSPEYKKLHKGVSVEENDSDSDEDSDDNTPKDDTDDDFDLDQEEIERRVNQKIDKHLTPIERFLAAPTTHPIAKNFLHNKEDKISPKGKKIAEIIQKHIDEGCQGKILVFTNWVASAKAIIAAFPEHIRAMTVEYKASLKVEKLAELKRPEKLVMVGVGKSMNTGLNLQFCSRLILSETVWSPGDLEQSLARVYRPIPLVRDPETGLFVKDSRDTVYIDHLVCDGTIDVRKTSSLVAKLVEVAKTFNCDNPLYKDLPDINQPRLSIKSLKNAKNSMAEDLHVHFEAFGQLLDAEKEDFRIWRLENEDKMHPTDVANGGLFEGSKSMKRVPYVPGMFIFGAKELGLVPFNEWRQSIIQEDGKFDLEKYKPVLVHTEAGEGFAMSVGGSKKRGKVVNPGDISDTTSVEQNDFDDFDDNDILQKIAEEEDLLEMETEDIELDTTGKGNVKVQFTRDSDDTVLNYFKSLKDYEDFVSVSTNYVLATFPQTAIFVCPKEISTKDVRDTLLKEAELPIDENGLVLPALDEWRKSKGMTVENNMRKLQEDDEKRRAKEQRRRQKEAEAEAKRKAREERRKKQVEENRREVEEAPPVVKRGRGRPPKVNPNDKHLVPRNEDTPDGEIYLYLTYFNNAVALMATVTDPDVDMQYLKKFGFLRVPPFMHTRISSNIKIFEDFLNVVAPVFEDGEPITPDTPVIKETQVKRLEKKGKYYVDPKTGEKFSANIIDNGYYVYSRSDLPNFYIEDASRENLDAVYDNFNRMKQGVLFYGRHMAAELLSYEKLSKRKVTPGHLRMQPAIIKNRLHMIVDIGTHEKSVLTKLQNATAGITKVKWVKEVNDIRALFPNVDKAMDAIQQIKAHYGAIANEDELLKDYNMFKGRGKPRKMI